MKEIIKKADILIEAIPYLKAFRDKVVVIKYGGSAMSDTEARKGILKDIIFMNVVGIKPVLVHGGGPEISKRMKQLGKKIKFVKGMRVTDESVIKIVDRVLSKINRLIVSEIEGLEGSAKGLLGKRNNLVLARPINREFGFVGIVSSINIRYINRILRKGLIPIISSVGRGRVDRMLYNINADSVAASVAAALKAEKFVLFTNVEGILRDKLDASSLISTATVSQVNRLIKKGVIEEGMIPKVKACIKALNAGVRKAHIIGTNIPHSLLLEIFTKKGIGTQIVK